MLKRLVRIETQVGEPISAGNYTLVPLAKSIRFMIPGIPAGMVWNRPVAVVARTRSGEEHVLPIDDPTRRAVLSLWGAVIGSALFTLLFVLRRKVYENEKEKLP